MATKKQKEELIEILKFTPIRARILIQGYGGECYAGIVDRKIYDYFAKRKIHMDEYANDWENEFKVPEEFQPYTPGSPYECDGLFHMSGAELSNLNEIRVEEYDSGKDIWVSTVGYTELNDEGVEVEEIGGGELYDLCKEGDVVHWGGAGEKGCFFDAELTLREPFDPKKLKICYENCDDWYLIATVIYDGEELDGSGGYSTTGKWSENKWIIIGDEEEYEGVYREDLLDEEKIEEPNDSLDWSITAGEPEVTDWFDKEVKPVRKGTYEVVIDAPWPLSGIRMVEWTGRSWKEDGKKVLIKKWRGLKENPNEV